MQQNEYREAEKLANQQIDYLKIVRILWSRWYWIAGCVVIGMVAAYIYLWYTPPVYSTAGSLKFDDKRSEFSELLKVKTAGYDRTNKIQSEMFVIQSKDVLLNAISRLNYRVSYFVKGRVRTSEIYPEIPFPIEILRQDSAGYFKGLYNFRTRSASTFELDYGDSPETYSYGDTIKAPGIVFRVRKGNVVEGATYSFRLNDKEDLLGRVAGGLSMAEAAKSSNIMLLTQTDGNPYFAADVLNAILQEYLEYDSRQRSLSASQTIDFIDTQLGFLANKVQQSGSGLAEYKQSNQIVNLGTATEMSVNKLSQQEAQKNILAIEALAINQLEEQVLNNREQVSLNFDLQGNLDPLLAGLITQLNGQILERDKRLAIYTASSAPVLEIEKQLSETKRAIANNIRQLRERNQKTQKFIDSQIASARQSLNVLPSAEKALANLQANFEINQKVFSYLSEKKLEAQISKSAVVSGATIVDTASPRTFPISPVPNKVYSYAIFLGLLAGVGLIGLVRIVNPYVYDKETVESLSNTPIIGVIRKFPDFIDKNNRQILSVQKPKSVFAESIRSVRTNLSFLASEKKSKVICVTSEIAGEGKSFVTINLASTISLIDKKVLLIAADLRRSKLHKTFDVDNAKGLSTYLSSQNTWEEILLKTENPNLDFIPSGPVPPNPSELLHSLKMNHLLNHFSEHYDFILVDTAPVGLVSDSIPLIRNADINLFVIRSGVSKYNSVSIPDRISKEYNLKNVVIVLNAFDDDPLHSRYYSTNYATSHYSNYYYYSDYSGYAKSGYYTDDERRKWWQIWKKQAS